MWVSVTVFTVLVSLFTKLDQLSKTHWEFTVVSLVVGTV